MTGAADGLPPPTVPVTTAELMMLLTAITELAALIDIALVKAEVDPLPARGPGLAWAAARAQAGDPHVQLDAILASVTEAHRQALSAEPLLDVNDPDNSKRRERLAEMARTGQRIPIPIRR